MERDDLDQLRDEEKQQDEEAKMLPDLELTQEEKEKLENNRKAMTQVSQVPNKIVEVASNVISSLGKPALRLLPALTSASTETAKLYIPLKYRGISHSCQRHRLWHQLRA